jgi:succinate dehydrogenase / fumarate reductase cytochrome b subunit
MNWFIQFLTSSIGKKLIMSLTGLSLILFLPVHLLGNLLLLNDDGGESFNHYAHFMGTNPLVQLSAKGLYFFILLHAVQGILIYLKNRKVSGKKYAVASKANVTWASKNMMWLGILLLVFLGIHMGDFWFATKFQEWPTAELGLENISYGEDEPIKNLYNKVQLSFDLPIILAVYIISMIGLAFHLLHGFSSAFQTIGLNHKKYTPFIEIVGKIYAIAVPVLFALIPIMMFLGIKSPILIPAIL